MEIIYTIMYVCMFVVVALFFGIQPTFVWTGKNKILMTTLNIIYGTIVVIGFIGWVYGALELFGLIDATL